MLTEIVRNRAIRVILAIMLFTCVAALAAGIVFGTAPVQVLLVCAMAASAAILTTMLFVAVN